MYVCGTPIFYGRRAAIVYTISYISTYAVMLYIYTKAIYVMLQTINYESRDSFMISKKKKN
jgi:hypothetical protein